jgi:hypothetical protein
LLPAIVAGEQARLMLVELPIHLVEVLLDHEGLPNEVV